MIKIRELTANENISVHGALFKPSTLIRCFHLDLETDGPLQPNIFYLAIPFRI